MEIGLTATMTSAESIEYLEGVSHSIEVDTPVIGVGVTLPEEGNGHVLGFDIDLQLSPSVGGGPQQTETMVLIPWFF